MSELTKDFLKFVMEVVLFIIVLATLFSDQGIASNTFNYMMYVEPILLQNWISSAITVGSSSPGDFTATTKTTGQPYTINLTKENGEYYIWVQPQLIIGEVPTKFAQTQKTPIVASCSIPQVSISLKRNIVQTIVVKKVFSADGSCSMEISAPAQNVIVNPLTTSV